MKVTKTVRASKKVAPSTKRPVRANRRMIRSDEEIDEVIEEPVDEVIDEPVEDVIEDEIVDEEDVEEVILFEAEDVAEIIAEFVEEPVDYTIDDETAEVTFTAGEDEVVATPEGDEVVVEDSTRISKIAKKIAASKQTKRPTRRARK